MLVSFATCANAQRVSIGVVGGAALTDAFPEQTSCGSLDSFATGIRGNTPFKDYFVGARVQVRITDRWSVLADGLYRGGARDMGGGGERWKP